MFFNDIKEIKEYMHSTGARLSRMEDRIVELLGDIEYLQGTLMSPEMGEMKKVADISQEIHKSMLAFIRCSEKLEQKGKKTFPKKKGPIKKAN